MFHVRYGAKCPWPDPASCRLPVSQGVRPWEALERRRDRSSQGACSIAAAAASAGRGPVGRPHGCSHCAGQRMRGWRSRLLWQERACPRGGGCQASLGHLCTPQVSWQHPRPGDPFARSCLRVTSHRQAGCPWAPTAGGWLSPCPASHPSMSPLSQAAATAAGSELQCCSSSAWRRSVPARVLDTREPSSPGNPHALSPLSVFQRRAS